MVCLYVYFISKHQMPVEFLLQVHHITHDFYEWNYFFRALFMFLFSAVSLPYRVHALTTCFFRFSRAHALARSLFFLCHFILNIVDIVACLLPDVFVAVGLGGGWWWLVVVGF